MYANTKAKVSTKIKSKTALVRLAATKNMAGMIPLKKSLGNLLDGNRRVIKNAT